jgi:hypothetical protein
MSLLHFKTVRVHKGQRADLAESERIAYNVRNEHRE